MKEKFENRVVFAQNLARIMERKGKTRMDLCHDLDLKYSTVSDWLKAKTYPRIEALQKLAVYFSVSKPVLTEQWNSQLSDRGTMDCMAEISAGCQKTFTERRQANFSCTEKEGRRVSTQSQPDTDGQVESGSCR